MPDGFVKILSTNRRPIALIAMVLVVLQSVLSALALTRAVASVVANPFEAAICHGAGNDAGAGTSPGDAAPDGTGQFADCCTYCVVQSTAVPGPLGNLPRSVDPAGSNTIAERLPYVPPTGWRAIRAGFSQAPPTLHRILKLT